MKVILCLFALIGAAMSDSDSVILLKKSTDHFTTNMFQEVAKRNKGKSCVLSGFSVLSPLSLLTIASEGETHKELIAAIGLPNNEVIKTVAADFHKRLHSIKGVDLRMANKIYIQKDLTLNDEFAATAKDNFNTEVQNIDFSLKEKAAEEINSWVEDHTNKHIKNLTDPRSIEENTAAILVNAIYFKGTWLKPFKKEATYDESFHVTKEKTITLPMMRNSAHFNYAESAELDAKFLEMKYEGGETSLVVVLPNQVDGIDHLIEKLKDTAALHKALHSMTSQDVLVSLPRFKIETTTNLKDILEAMHVKTLFKADQAKLTHLIKTAQELYITSATQKTYIDVNEVGTEAAAANAFDIGYMISSQTFEKQYEFNADHPFLFFLMETNNVLINGVFQS